jgi:hypothetical protein
MSQDGLHGLRADWSRCAAGLVGAYEQAAVRVLVRPPNHIKHLAKGCRRTSGEHTTRRICRMSYDVVQELLLPESMMGFDKVPDLQRR